MKCLLVGYTRNAKHCIFSVISDNERFSMCHHPAGICNEVVMVTNCTCYQYYH